MRNRTRVPAGTVGTRLRHCRSLVTLRLVRRRVTILASTAVLGLGLGAALTPAAGIAAAPGAQATPSGHPLGGQPIDSPRCNKKLRKINRLDKQAERAEKRGKKKKAVRKQKKLKRVADNYNRTCRR